MNGRQNRQVQGLSKRRITVRAAHTVGFATGEEGSNKFAPKVRPQGCLYSRLSAQLRKDLISLLPRFLRHRRGSHSSGTTTGRLRWLVLCLLVNLALLVRQLLQPAGYRRVISANPGS